MTDVASLRLAWPIGKRVEVMQSDEGYEGSWYAGAVVSYEAPLVVVRYDELFEGDDSEPDEPPTPAPPDEAAANGHRPNLANLVNAEPVSQMRPEPPTMEPADHAAWASGLQPGAALDLSFDGGFWDVELVSVQGVAQPAGRRSSADRARAAVHGGAHGGQRRAAPAARVGRRAWGVGRAAAAKGARGGRRRPRLPRRGRAPRQRAAPTSRRGQRRGRPTLRWEPSARAGTAPCGRSTSLTASRRGCRATEARGRHRCPRKPSRRRCPRQPPQRQAVVAAATRSAEAPTAPRRRLERQPPPVPPVKPPPVAPVASAATSAPPPPSQALYKWRAAPGRCRPPVSDPCLLLPSQQPRPRLPTALQLLPPEYNLM